MRVRTIINLVIPALTAVAVVLMFFNVRTSLSVSTALENAALSQNIGIAVMDIQVLTTDFLELRNVSIDSLDNRTTRITTQFKQRIGDLDNFITKLEASGGDRLVLRNMRRSVESLQYFLQELEITRQDQQDNEKYQSIRPLLQGTALTANRLTALSNRLGKSYSGAVAKSGSDLAKINVTALAGVAVVIATSYFFLVFFIFRPLQRLNDRVLEMAPSSAEETTNSHIGNEFAALSAEFDRRYEAMLRFQEELETQRKDLAQSNSDLQNFAHVASHDLRSPLRGIRNAAEWIAEDMGDRLDPESIENLKLMTSRIDRLDALLGGLLDYSRISTGKHDFSTVEPSKIGKEVAFVLNPPAGIKIVIDDNIPAFKTVYIHLYQVIHNLFDNAIKHHDRDQGTISLSGRQEGRYIRLEVEDDGPGIAKEYHAKALQMFQTLQSRDTKEGSGMGLALVKKIVERYGGYMEIDSPVSTRGCIMRIFWPKDGVQ